MVDDLPKAAELRLTVGRDDDDVRMGAHQAVCADEDPVTAGVLLDEAQKKLLGGLELREETLVE